MSCYGEESIDAFRRRRHNQIGGGIGLSETRSPIASHDGPLRFFYLNLFAELSRYTEYLLNINQIILKLFPLQQI